VRRGRPPSFAAVALAALVGGSCTGGGPVDHAPSPPRASLAIGGGRIVLGAEDYPRCLNPLTDCASTPWLYWTVVQHVMPRAMQLTLNGTYTNSPLLTEAPSLDNGDLTQDPFTVTYRINPVARWADGTPITCADFEFTREAIVDTKEALGRAGYEPISSIGCSDPHRAVVAYKDAYVGWPEDFGGAKGVILEKRAFPAEMNGVRVDLSGEMQDGIPFSGGPWKLAQWSPSRAVLVPNTNYWGHRPYLDQVTIFPSTDQAEEVNDVLSDRVDAIFPQQLSFGLPVGTNPFIKYRAGPGVFYEALWMNVSKFPFNDPMVRQAFFWAVDRQAVLNALVQRLDPSQTKVLGCGFPSLPGSFWCDQMPFARFHYNPTQVADVLRADAWSRDPRGFWAKGAFELSFEYATSAGGLHTATQMLLRDKLVKAGFNVTTRVYSEEALFDEKLPHGDFQVVDFARYGTPDPSATGFLRCVPVGPPGPGTNFQWCNQEAEMALRQSDRELDPDRRRDLLNQVYQAEADDFAPGLPLYAVPLITLWRADRLAGPVGRWNDTFYRGFFNMDQWSCAQPGICL
jgi:peptide/nickel transport system substrate-binding protein